ncbi:MAG: hypothetical protein AB8G99_07425 [Planctomycetaceae bacterium]
MPRFTSASRHRCYRAAIGGGLLFVLLTSAAMVVYPGGTRIDPTAERYLFSQNYFSDLGRTHDFEENSNLPSMLLFSSALLTVGCTTVALFLSMPDLFENDRFSRFVSLLVTGFGLIAGTGFVGIALTPWDLFFPQHDLCVNVGFRSLLLGCVAAMINIYRAKRFPNLFGHLMVVVSFVLLGYILLLAFGPGPDEPVGLTIQVGGQKVVAYTLVAGITCLAFGAMRVERQQNVSD